MSKSFHRCGIFCQRNKPAGRYTQGAKRVHECNVVRLSGGALQRLTVFALGVMPYISSSIIMQLFSVIVPKLEQLKKENSRVMYSDKDKVIALEETIKILKGEIIWNK